MSDPVPKQFAVAYRHPRFFCIETWSGYRSSASDPKGAQHLLPPASDDAALGCALADALSRSRFFSIKELEPDGEGSKFFDYEARKMIYDTWVQNLMKSQGLATKRALFKELDRCNVISLGGNVSIKPARHVKLEAWTELATPTPDIVVPAAKPAEEIGAALRHAFSLCTHG